jgi:hypothetical protein
MMGTRTTGDATMDAFAQIQQTNFRVAMIRDLKEVVATGDRLFAHEATDVRSSWETISQKLQSFT